MGGVVNGGFYYNAGLRLNSTPLAHNEISALMFRALEPGPPGIPGIQVTLNSRWEFPGSSEIP